MKKKVAVLSVLLVFFVSTTALASSGYMGQSIAISNSNSGSSSVGTNTTRTARVDVSTISDTAGCRKVNVFIMNTGTGKVTPTQTFQVQNSRFFDVNTGNIKAEFRRNTTTSGTMRIGYNFVYNY